MAPRKPKPAPEAKSAVNPGKVSKSKQKTTVSEASARTQPRVKQYKNKLLNLEETPSHLVAIVKRNATESPLLRLPAEIRNVIWNFTCGNELVELPDSDRHGKGGAVRHTYDRATVSNFVWPYPDLLPSEKLPSAFHLPEICRQTYAETVLLAYSRSTFAVGISYLICRNGITRLAPVQRRAITSIELSPAALRAFAYNRRIFKPLKAYFPHLRVVIVSRLALKVVPLGWFRPVVTFDDGSVPISRDAWKLWITQALKKREGNDIEVEFKDNDHY